MAKERRTFTNEDKAKVVAYAAEHGIKVTAEHFNIVPSVIRRWRLKAGHKLPPVRKKRKWTPEKIKAVLEYKKTHSNQETMDHFKVSSGQIHVWRTGVKYSRRKKANGAGNGALRQLEEKEAVMWLERWRQAYLDQVKREMPSAVDMLHFLRGAKV